MTTKAQPVCKSLTGNHVLRDWRGKDYTVGTEIVYPRQSGRSVEMSDGVVLEVYQVYRSKARYEWKRYTPDVPPQDISTNYSDEPNIEWRVKVQPHGLGSRDFWRGDWSTYRDVRDGKKSAKLKPVTLINIENVTVIGSGYNEDDVLCLPSDHHVGIPASGSAAFVPGSKSWV